MNELLDLSTNWYSLPLGALIFTATFGFAPGFMLRLLVLIYPKDGPRRKELVAELYVLGRLERLLFVGEQLETVLLEGLPNRIRGVAKRIRSRGESDTRITEQKSEKLAADFKKKYEKGASIRALAEGVRPIVWIRSPSAD